MAQFYIELLFVDGDKVMNITALRKIAKKNLKQPWYKDFCTQYDTQNKPYLYFKERPKLLEKLMPYIGYYPNKSGPCLTIRELWILRNPLIDNSCAICGKETNVGFNGYLETCSTKCAAKHCVPKREKTCLERYKVTNPSKNAMIKERRVNTFRERFGTDNPFQNSEVKKKIAKTNLKNLGVENPSQSKKIINKKKATYLKNFGEEHWTKNKEVYMKSGLAFDAKKISKSRETYFERTGYYNPLLNPKVKKKIAKTNLKKYGIENQFNSPEFQKQLSLKYLADTGYKNPFQNPEVKKKIVETNLERYGIEYPRLLKSLSFQKKQIKDANNILHEVLGYEHFLIEKLSNLENFISLTTDSAELPKIKYKFKNKDRTYYPDMMLTTTKGKYLIEVKSWHTLWRDLRVNLAKFKAATKVMSEKDITFMLAVGRTSDKKFLLIKNPVNKTILREHGLRFTKTGCHLVR
jgi:hypothetical protein